MKERTERVFAALRGEGVDRVPFAAWMHLATQHLAPSDSASLHEKFFRRFDLDLMKVMNDYPYPLPEGVDQVDTVEAMRRFEPIVAGDTVFPDQLVVIRTLRERLGEDAIILDTVFNPFGVVQVLLKQSLDDMLQRHADDVQHLLSVIADSLQSYVSASLNAGASGIFYSVNGAKASWLSDERFEQYVRAPDLQVLAACREAPMNVCHAHADEPRLADLVDYPVHAFSWSHLTTTPSVSEFREFSDACVIGGINEQLTIIRRQPGQIRDDVLAMVADAGRARCIVGPGCSLATETPVNLIDAARSAAWEA